MAYLIKCPTTKMYYRGDDMFNFNPRFAARYPTAEAAYEAIVEQQLGDNLLVIQL